MKLEFRSSKVATRLPLELLGANDLEVLVDKDVVEPVDANAMDVAVNRY